MKKLFTVVAMLFSICSIAQTKQQRNIGSFTGISAATGIQVEITQGNNETVFVSSSNDMYTENIKTVVENGVLKIYYENKDWKNKKEPKLTLKAFVNYKNIDQLRAGSGAGIIAVNTIKVPILNLAVNSGAQFAGEINTTDLLLEQNSGAVSKITGRAANTKADLSSGAVCTSPNLSTEMCQVDASSGAVFKIGVSKKLSAKVSSGAMVAYNGDGVIEKKKVSSGGSIKKI